MSSDICSCLKKNGEKCNYKAKKEINNMLYCKIHWKKILRSQQSNESDRIIDFSLDNNLTCSICLSKMLHTKKINLCATTCWHIFHINCINKWIMENNTCPVCRFHQNKNDLVLLRKFINPCDVIISSLKKNFKIIVGRASIDKLQFINKIFGEILKELDTTIANIQ